MFALIHSPLVGPSTWQLVAAQLAQQRYQVIVPTLVDAEGDGRAYWEQHADSAAHAINAARSSASCILVGHSGAGPLLPAIGERLDQPPTGYLFVDAGLPRHLATRLELMRSESEEWAAPFEQHMTAGGRFPTWSDVDLHALIPDAGLRGQVLNEVKARTLTFFTEPISAPGRWFQVSCGYLQFSSAYDVPAGQAQASGWPFVHLQAGHFHMVVDPYSVARALIQIEEQMFNKVLAPPGQK
jgi:hypothetical protein